MTCFWQAIFNVRRISVYVMFCRNGNISMPYQVRVFCFIQYFCAETMPKAIEAVFMRHIPVILKFFKSLRNIPFAKYALQKYKVC